MSEFSDRVTRWITMLAALLNPMFPGEALEALNRIKPHLGVFAPSAFTPDTARAVAAAKRFGAVPGWDVIEPILRQAVRDARPANYGLLPSPREPDRQPASLEEILAVRELAREARNIALEGADDVAPLAPKPLPDVSLKGALLHAARAKAALA